MLRIIRAVVILLLCLTAPIGCRTSAARLLGGALAGNFAVSGGSFSQQNQSFQSVGACCIPTGDCLTVTASDCANFSGTFFGEGIICEIAPCSSGF